MQESIVFYTHPMSRGRIARWMLEEIGQPYRTEILDYGTTMKSPEYLAINPMGKVPAIRHDGQVVTECAAICAYLADVFPQAGLGPLPAERGAYYRWLFYAAGPIEAAMAHRALQLSPPPDKQAMLGYGSVERVADTLEQVLPRAPYITGERFTAADVYLGAEIGWATQFGILERRPAYVAYLERLHARPAWQRAKQLDDAALAALKKGG